MEITSPIGLKLVKAYTGGTSIVRLHQYPIMAITTMPAERVHGAQPQTWVTVHTGTRLINIQVKNSGRYQIVVGIRDEFQVNKFKNDVAETHFKNYSIACMERDMPKYPNWLQTRLSRMLAVEKEKSA